MALEPDAVDLRDMEDEDDWPTPAEAPHGQVRIVIEGNTSDPYLMRTVTRLLLGGATEGGEQLAQLLKAWQVKTDSLGSAIYSESPDETDAERVRYAMIGLLSKGPVLAEGVLATAVQASDLAFGLFYRLISPVTNSGPMQPVMRRYNRLAARGEIVFENWIDLGRAAEQRSRALAREAASGGMDEALDVVIEKMAHDEDVRDLITQQGMGMADEVRDAIRHQTARADARWERRLRRLFGRR